MAFAVKYRSEFDTIKGRRIKVDIEEDAFGGSITTLTASGLSPLKINYPNGEFDKLTGIRESKVEFLVLNDTVTAADFLTTSDNQYKLKIYVNDTLEWVGWLDNDQLQETFIDTPTEIRLTANDGLSLIKNKEFDNAFGAQFWGIASIKGYIGVCLHNTELDLRWTSFINMYPEGEDQRGVDPDFDAFYYAHVTSFTFLTGPRNYDDCYTVLSKIMESFGCMLFQARGQWWIIQTNDRISGQLDGTQREDAVGTQVNVEINDASYQFEIGLNKDHKLRNADALIGWEKAFKNVSIDYEFKMPPVFFRNFDLLDGSFVAPPSTSSRAVYTLDHWTELNLDTFVGVEIDTTVLAELRRYIFQIPNSPYGTVASQSWVRTTSFYINANDRVSFSYQTSEKNSVFALGKQVHYVVLTDGVDTYRLTEDGRWIIPSSTTPGFGAGGVGYTWLAAEDRRFWKSYSITAVDPTPVSGEIYLLFVGQSHANGGANNEVRFMDIQFSITPYFNEKLTVSGYEQKSEQAATLKNNYDNQIYISKSDNIGTQGAILNPDYSQILNWKYYTEDDADAVPFHKYITRAYWKCVYRNFVKMEASLFNLHDGRLISLLNTCTIDDIPDTEFLITTMSSDIRQESSEVTLVEVRDTSSTDDFDELAASETFKYLNVRQEIFNEIPEEKKPLEWRFGPIGLIVSLMQRNKRRRFNNYS